VQVKVENLEEQQENIIHIRCHVQNKVYNMIINNESCTNVTNIDLLDKLDLHTTEHLIPYKL
jgi:hypothetical protein